MPVTLHDGFLSDADCYLVVMASEDPKKLSKQYPEMFDAHPKEMERLGTKKIAPAAISWVLGDRRWFGVVNCSSLKGLDWSFRKVLRTAMNCKCSAVATDFPYDELLDPIFNDTPVDLQIWRRPE